MYRPTNCDLISISSTAPLASEWASESVGWAQQTTQWLKFCSLQVRFLEA
jgi:hypothetical protein